jgi:hypothetical protein
MSYSNLSVLNNHEAAKVAARRGTPYVPWNKAEVLSAGFLDRLPKLGLKTPVGWQRVDSWTVDLDHLKTTVGQLGLLYDIEDVLSTAKVTLGFAFVDDLCVVYKPLPQAHETLKSDRK